MELSSKKITDIYWYPVNFNLIGKKIKLKYTPIIFDNFFKANVYEFLFNPKDIKFNKKTGMFLTNMLVYENIYEDQNSPEVINKLTKIETPLKTTDSYVITLSSYNNNTVLYKSYEKNFSKTETIKILFEDDYVMLESEDGNVLTYNTSDELFFKTKITPPSNTQKFNYFLGDDNIILYSYDSNFTKAVTVNSNRILKLLNASYQLNSTIEDDKIFTFISYESENLQTNSIKNSYFCRYVSSPLVSQKDIIPSEESLTENYQQNLLCLFPYNNFSYNETEKTVEYDIQIHGLKNYQTPEYNYSRGFDYIKDYPSIRREYHNIYSGTNQDKGMENVCLGFVANTYLKKFEPDNYTVFYFPATTDRISVHDSGMIEDGSYYGEMPYTSDRIYARQISYDELTPGVPQPPSMPRLDGTWLCTWLSGNPTGDKQWMDRYFNSAYYTVDEALKTTDLLYNEKLNPDIDFEVWDEPSSLIFEPGGQYIYFRSGQENSRTFLKYLSSDFYNPLGSKILDVSSFDSSPILDNTPYINNGFIVGEVDSPLKKDYLTLNGKNHIIFPAKNVLLEKNNLTVSMWLKVDNWDDINADQIIGNYYDSGFGLINESALTSPIFSVVETTSGNLFNLNYKLSHLETINLSKETDSENHIIQRLVNFEYWIIDKQNRKLRRYSVEGKVQKTVDIPSNIISYIDQVEIDSHENLYLFNIENKKIVKLSSNGSYLETITLTMAFKRIELGIDNSLKYSFGETSCIDNENNLWQVVGGNLYKNEEIYANIGPVQQITCDANNNLWIVHIKDKITKFNIDENKFEFTKSIGKNSLIDDDCFEYNGQFRFLNFLKTPKISKTCVETDSKTEDLAVLIDDSDKLIYLINSEGSLITKLSLYGLVTVDLAAVNDGLQFKSIGDFSSYQFLRKYGAREKNLSWKFKIGTVNEKDTKLLKLTYDVGNIPPGWHNFSFVFNSTEGTAKYYIDTYLVDTSIFEKAKYQLQYDYKSSILVGASNIKNTTLNDLIQIDDAYKLIGDVGQIIMYNKPLTQGEISEIYFSSPLAVDKGSLKWNIPIGKRNYVEEIQHWFQMQLPTNKSKYYNINIHNLEVDGDVKKLIEDSIKNSVKKITPAHTDLYKVNWLNSSKK